MRKIATIILFLPLLIQAQTFYPRQDTVYNGKSRTMRPGDIVLNVQEPIPPEHYDIKMVVSNDSVKFNLYNVGTLQDLRYFIDWGDGETDTANSLTPANLHVYSSAGSYTVRIDSLSNAVYWRFEAQNTSLTSLKVDSLPKLQYLYCDTNSIATLDVSKNTELIGVSADFNHLTSFDISGNTKLNALHITSNLLTSIDVSGCMNMDNLNTSYNADLDTIDLTDNTKLTFLDVGNCAFDYIDVSNNTKLTTLGVHNCNLTTIDVSGLVDLLNFWINTNPLTSLDISNNTKLIYLYCFDTDITSLDVTANTKLQYIDASNATITSIDVSNCAELLSLVLPNCGITSLNLTANVALNYLYIRSNSINEAGITSIINTMVDRSATTAGDARITPQGATFPQSLTAGQQSALTSKNWTY